MWYPFDGTRSVPGLSRSVFVSGRFRNPDDGDVTWDDLVKGPITINNRELDDRLAAEVRQLDGPAVLIRKLELGGTVSWFDHVASVADDASHSAAESLARETYSCTGNSAMSG